MAIEGKSSAASDAPPASARWASVCLPLGLVLPRRPDLVEVVDLDQAWARLSLPCSVSAPCRNLPNSTSLVSSSPLSAPWGGSLVPFLAAAADPLWKALTGSNTVSQEAGSRSPRQALSWRPRSQDRQQTSQPRSDETWAQISKAIRELQDTGEFRARL